jgi:hypothetical protein
MTRQFEMVASRYGAPIGRHASGTLENVEPRTLRLFQVRLDRGGYDDGGAYWGHGIALWCATDGAGFQQFTRAGSRERAACELGIAPDYLDRLALPLGRVRLVQYVTATLDGKAPHWEGWSNADACDILRACGVATGAPNDAR